MLAVCEREGVLARRGRAWQDNNRQSGWSAVRGARGADAAMAGTRLFICAIDRFQREKGQCTVMIGCEMGACRGNASA